MKDVERSIVRLKQACGMLKEGFDGQATCQAADVWSLCLWAEAQLNTTPKPSPSLLRAWASDPMLHDIMLVPSVVHHIRMRASEALLQTANAMERSLSPDAKVAQIVERAEEEKP